MRRRKNTLKDEKVFIQATSVFLLFWLVVNGFIISFLFVTKGPIIDYKCFVKKIKEEDTGINYTKLRILISLFWSDHLNSVFDNDWIRFLTMIGCGF